MIPTIYEPIITKAIRHIINTSVAENTFKIAIIKSDVSDHFLVCIVIPWTNLFAKNDHNLYKRIIYDEKIEAFLQNLHQYDWDTNETHQDTNEACDNSVVIFCTIYDTFFPMKMIK